MSLALLPKGSIILVTGVNGFIASHVADQLLEDGYVVRGSVRSQARAKPLIEYFEGKFGKNRFELAIVPDITVEGAFEEAVKGKVLSIARDRCHKPRN